jgi:PAS domain S-box-containing protein
MLWPIWPGCALLVAVLLLVPRRIWPILIAAGLGGFFLYDLRVGLPFRPTLLLVLADIAEVLIAALGVSYCFDGLPRLSSIKSLLRYSFFSVLLAPLAAASISSISFGENYWIRWRIGFFTEALALLTLTPAILSWVIARRTWTPKPPAFYFEAVALIGGLGSLGYVAFIAPGRAAPPLAIYSLLPLLLWAALRFGLVGTSTSMVAVAFLSTWGAVHGRGPFASADSVPNIMSLQLFLFFAATTFTVLAVLVEEQKQTEQAFRESEKRFRLMADTAPVLIWMSDNDKLCTYFNKPWLEFTGRSIELEWGNGWADGVHPDDLRTCMDTYSQAFDRREEFRIEYRLRRHDGEYRWVLDIGVPRFSQDRSFIGYIGVGVDVTERKHAERALEKSEEKFSKAFRQSPMVLTLTSTKDHRYIDVNETFERITGWRRDEVIGRTPFDIGFWLHSSERVELTKRLLSEGHLREVETRFRMKDGTIRIGSAAAELIELNGEPCMLAVGADITERKHAEEALRVSEERFRLAAQAGKMFAYEWDAATDVILYSREAIQILGINEATQLTGQQALARVHSEDRERLLAAVAALTPEKPDLRVSYRMIRPDNDLIWLERTSRALFDEQGKMLRIVGMVTDITERKRVVEALERSESNYRMFVAQSSEGIFCQELERPVPMELSEDEQVQRILHESYLAECNDALARMYGMSPANFVGKPLAETLDIENPVNIELTRDYIRSGYRVVDRESHEVDPQGNPKVFLNSMIGIVENNMLLRTWGIQRDITERRQAEQARVQAEQALRESEQRLRLATQAGKMYAYEWDLASDRVVRSEENVNVLGFSDQAERLTRQQVAATVHPDDLAKFITAVADLSPEKPTTQISYRVLRPDGAVIWVEKRGRAFFDERGRMSRMIGMVADITERKRAEEALRESEAYLAEAQSLTHTGSGAWRVPGGDALYLSDEWYRIYGFDLKEGLSAWNDRMQRIHPEDRAKVRETKDRAIREKSHYEMDYRIVLPDGTVKYTHTVGHPVLNASGDVVQFVFTMMDVTERKRSEEALSSMSRRLIEAQEQERTRIARELHDDLGQRLALLANELVQLQQDASTLPETGRRISVLQKHATDLAMDIQTLSHELHSSKLEFLGIAAAMRGFCQEFVEQTKLKIDFKSHDLPSPLSTDVSLCLFRVLQEALHNSAKHSRVRHVEVQLWGTSDEIHLTVSDSGAGFDSKTARQNRGLGLISMEERLKLVKGTLSIESQLKRGTTIHARVPLSAEIDSMRAAG